MNLNTFLWIIEQNFEPLHFLSPLPKCEIIDCLALNRSFNADILDDDKKTQRGKLTRGSSADEPAISASSDMLNGHAKSATLEWVFSLLSVIMSQWRSNVFE